jgi:threonine/homoserine/homoserine lactone efflux protein
MSFQLSLIFRYFLSGASLGISAAASPGPFQAYLFSQTSKIGWRKTLVAVLAPLLSDGPIIFIVLFILTRLPDSLLTGLQIAGGILLIYFSWRTFKEFRQFEYQEFFSSEQKSQSLLEAVIVNVMGPGPWIFWSLVGGPILLEGWQVSPWVGVTFLIGFYAAMILVNSAFILITGTTRQLGPKFTRIQLGLSTIILLFFGIYQIYSGIF